MLSRALEGFKVVGIHKETLEFSESDEEYTKDEADALIYEKKIRAPQVRWEAWTPSRIAEYKKEKGLS